MNIEKINSAAPNQRVNVGITGSKEDEGERCYSLELASAPSLFQLCAETNTPKASTKPVDAACVVSSTKHSEWGLNKHWLEIKTADNKVYQSFLPVAELQEIEYLMKGEEIIVKNEQILFGHFGYSTFDLFIPRLNRTLIGEGVSTITYSPVHEGKEVHAVFEVYANPVEKSLSFKIENGEKYKLFFNDVQELEGWQSGQEIEIFYEEPLYEKNPLSLLGIKNDRGPLYENIPLLLLGIKILETNKEYFVKADAIYRWQPKKEDHYRVMTQIHFTVPGTEDAPQWRGDTLRADDGQQYTMMHTQWSYRPEGLETLLRTTGSDGDKVMILEPLGHQSQAFGRIVYFYKMLNLPSGEVYVQASYDPQFHTKFNAPLSTL